jgi:hypothetical protein
MNTANIPKLYHEISLNNMSIEPETPFRAVAYGAIVAVALVSVVEVPVVLLSSVDALCMVEVVARGSEAVPENQSLK